MILGSCCGLKPGKVPWGAWAFEWFGGRCRFCIINAWLKPSNGKDQNCLNCLHLFQVQSQKAGPPIKIRGYFSLLAIAWLSWSFVWIPLFCAGGKLGLSWWKDPNGFCNGPSSPKPGNGPPCGGGSGYAWEGMKPLWRAWFWTGWFIIGCRRVGCTGWNAEGKAGPDGEGTHLKKLQLQNAAFPKEIFRDIYAPNSMFSIITTCPKTRGWNREVEEALNRYLAWPQQNLQQSSSQDLQQWSRW